MVARRLPAPVRRLAAEETGSAMVEVALVLPLLLVLAFGVVMVGRVTHAQIAVQSVAREAARTVAVSPSAEAGLQSAEARAVAVAQGHGLALDRLGVEIDPGAFERGGTVLTRATYDVHLGDLPLLGMVGVTVSSSHAERIDQYRSRAAAP